MLFHTEILSSVFESYYLDQYVMYELLNHLEVEFQVNYYDCEILP